MTFLKYRIDAVLKLQPQSNKIKIHEFLGMPSFLSKHVCKTQLYLRPFLNIFRQQNKFECSLEHQNRFDENKTFSQNKI